jgi:hypothetical protein
MASEASPGITPGGPVRSLYALAQLPSEQQLAWGRRFLPADLLQRFDIDPLTLRNPAGECAVRLIPLENETSIRLEVWRRLSDQDPVILIVAGDTPNGQTELYFLNVNDPDAPRFNVDVDPEGRFTYLGLGRRNIPEEVRAMEHGLAPGQVRRGLGIVNHRLIPLVHEVLAEIGKQYMFAQPLAYHTAVLMERWGMRYLQGERFMRELDRRFRPGGDLFARMDGSTPFRRPENAHTIRGRSWAIHDGVLGEPWPNLRMVLHVGQRAEVNTCPGVPY